MSVGSAIGEGSAVIDAEPVTPPQPAGTSDIVIDAPVESSVPANRAKPELSPAPSAGKNGKTTKSKRGAKPKKKAKPEKSFADGVTRPLSQRELRQMAMVYGISVVLHLLIGVGLALYVFEPELVNDTLAIITSAIEEEEEPIEDVVEFVETEEVPEEIESDVAPEETVADVEETESPIDIKPEIPEEAAVPETETNEQVSDPSAEIAKKGELAGRASGSAKQALLKAHGGNDASEQAVVRGLRWLASVQNKETGAWSFDSAGKGGKAGSLKNARNGATGMALLAFLGAGHTPIKGKHKETVLKGLEYLTKSMKRGPSNTGDLSDKNASAKHAAGYTHAIATLALCEAYALSKAHLEQIGKSDGDEPKRKTTKQRAEERRQRTLATKLVKQLRDYAQLAVNFCVYAQDPKGGGWRYNPKQAGDTSATGWYIMALHSGRAAGLSVPTNTLRGGYAFLNHVSVNGGAQYGYTDGKGPNTTRSAVGLLCRMYLGWKADKPALGKGVDLLAKSGPTINNMYYNYYATQVLHHWGGEKWKKWNEVNRDTLVASQITKGSAAGSWNPTGGHGATGGSLLQTCFCVMTLEVYYRHLPIYRRSKVQGDF